MHHMNDKQFKRMFRLSRESFYLLLEEIRPKIEPITRGKINAMNRSGSYITGETKLAIALRWLAGGMHYDTCCFSRTSR